MLEQVEKVADSRRYLGAMVIVGWLIAAVGLVIIVWTQFDMSIYAFGDGEGVPLLARLQYVLSQLDTLVAGLILVVLARILEAMLARLEAATGSASPGSSSPE